jgi:hypothetical protein
VASRAWWIAVLAACGGTTPPLQTADPGVVFAYPADRQIDVPLGTRIVVTFSERVTESAFGACSESSGAFCLVGPSGVVDAQPVVVGDGFSVEFPATTPLEGGTEYRLFVRNELVPAAKNLSQTDPLVTFTTRSARPNSAAPSLIGVNGAAPTTPEAFRPMLESSTIRLVFSEPLDPRTTELGANAIELVDASGAAVPATLIAKGIHAAIDPKADLLPGTTYTLRIGSLLRDLSGQPVTPTNVALTPVDSGAARPIAQVLKTRQANDPGPSRTRSGADVNVVAIDKPLIGRELSTVLPASLAANLGDPDALGGPIAFTIPKGQRLALSGLDVKLGGEIPAGLSTGDIQIEFLTDAGGRIYRNPFQPDEQRPENLASPLYVDLSMDIAIYTVDPIGNAAISQIALGVQATGTALAIDGVLAIESVASMEMGLLGVTSAPTNLVLELITDTTGASAPRDTDAPTLMATYPGEGTQDIAVGGGIELVFSEPIDLERVRAGGIKLATSLGAAVPFVVESHGATVVLRPRARLPYSTTFTIALDDVTDLAGNPISARPPIAFSTPQFAQTGVAMTVLAVHPGVPCTLTGASALSPGRCAGGEDNDDIYAPFELAANEPVEVEFSQPLNGATVALGTACNTGNVRVEEFASGTCIRPVPGSLIRRERGLLFVPDVPWAEGTSYRFTMVSGGDDDCDGGELCGLTGDAASFDALNGVDGGGGGGNLTISFTGKAATGATYLFSAAGPYTDINGDGQRNGGEIERDENRGAMRIVGTTGDVTGASFNGNDCLPDTPEREGCIYLTGSMPTQLGELTTEGCPSGGSCIPVFLTPQAMFATSLSMTTTVDAPIIGNTDIDADTGITMMRIREPASGGGVVGHIVDGGGTPKMIVALDLYMDAPDMSLPLSADHDLISKPLSVVLEGPVTFLADGRIVIALANTADVPVTVNIDAPLGLGGGVNMILPAGEMKLQLVSRPLRGAEP